MYKKFCYMCLTFSLILLLAAGLFNVVVDPYGVWDVCRIAGFNMGSTKSEQTEYMLKPIEVARQRPDTIFLGTSQVMYALDMEAYESATGKRAYNFGERGAALYESRRSLEHALAVDPELKEVYFGLTYEKFVDGDHLDVMRVRPWFQEIECQIGSAYVVPVVIAKTVFSWQALKDSTSTIVENQRFHWEHPRYVKGRPCDDNLLEFNLREHRQFNHTLKVLQRDGVFTGTYIDEDAMAELRNIVRLCREHELKLTMFIPPVHARCFEARSSAWNVYEDWLREVVSIYPVLDFSGYDDITMSEAAAGQVVSDTNPYFWDVAHGKAILSEKILPDLLGGLESQPAWGTWVTPENVEARLSQLRQEMLAWEENHPESVEENLYYASFSTRIPDVLNNVEMWAGLEAVMIEGNSVGQGGTVKLRQSEALDVCGVIWGQSEGLAVMYALLESNCGAHLYALAEPAYISQAERVFGSSALANRGFRVMERLWDVPPGSYQLCLVGVTASGQVLRSGNLCTLELREAAIDAQKVTM